MDILRAIADNPALTSALTKLLEEACTVPFDHTNLTNEQIGERVRAQLVGLQAIKDVFKKIASYKSVPVRPEPVNRAR